MRVGVIDVGANTARLLVARVDGRGLVERVYEERAEIGLGAEIEARGKISKRKRTEVAATVAHAVASARAAGAQQVEVIVTSPGRQCDNAAALEGALARAVGSSVRMLSAHEEARLAFLGAAATTAGDRVGLAVCDVGGGSTQIALGSIVGVPAWTASIDLGSLRLARRCLRDDPPSGPDLRASRIAVRTALAPLTVPPTSEALATGGTARALRKLVGATLGREQLEEALSLLSARPSREISTRIPVPEWRTKLLPAGAVILSEVQRLLGQPLVVARGGVREGAAIELRQRTAAAA
jgi:exopolyphosphatase/guanosine-5'-triphosphate,3'-diphosphate pyrophosphatase